MNNRYLFLSPSFSKNANAECIKRVIKELPNLNDVYAVTYSNAGLMNDFGIEEILLPLRPWDKLSLHASKGENRKIIPLFLKVLLILKRLLMLPIWPVYSLSCAFHFYKSASTVIKEKQITHVIAVCYPGDTLLALCFLKLRYGKKIKTIMYPLDVFVCGKYDGFSVENKLSSFLI